MKFLIAAACVIIGLAALFHSSAAAGLTVNQKKYLLKIIAFLFDMETVGGKDNDLASFQSKDLKINPAEAKGKFEIIKAGQLFGFNGEGIVEEIRSSKDYAFWFSEIFPDNVIVNNQRVVKKEYNEEDIIQILENLSGEPLQKLKRLLFLIMGEGKDFVQLPQYTRLVQVFIGLAEFTEKEDEDMRKIFEKVNNNKETANWTWNEFKSVIKTGDLADLICADYESFQTPQEV